jgi:hypothetical protein
MENREISAPGADFVDGLILGDHLENAPSWRDDDDEEDDLGCRCETDNQITCATKPPPDDEDDD